MSAPTTNDGSVIESAMSRLDSEGDADPAEAKRSIGRRDYDLALAHRLAQLRVAMGEEPPAASTVPTPAPAQISTAHHFGAGSLLLTALISALTGALLTYQAMRSSDAPAVQQTQMISTAPKPASAPVAVVPAPSQQTAVLAGVSPAKSDEAQVRENLEAWRRAWSDRDSETYLSRYSPDFAPADGRNFNDWAVTRRKKLASRKEISIAVRDLQIESIDAQKMRVGFLQDYASGNYRETAQAKTLLFVRQGSDWLIAGEWQGSSPKATPAP